MGSTRWKNLALDVTRGSVARITYLGPIADSIGPLTNAPDGYAREASSRPPRG